MKRITLLVCLILALVIVFTCSKKEPSAPPEEGPEWTIIVYCDGNNDLDDFGGSSCVIADVQEMEKVGSTDKVKIIAMVGSFKTGGQCKYYYVEKHTDELPDQISSTELDDLGTKDMSDPATLKAFITYAKTNYEAEHYMLIIDDHGGGWRGCCVDEQNGAGDFMNLPELKSAVADAGVHFDIICFHCCLMSMVEVAHQLKGYGDYMVASQFVMPMRSVLGSEEWLGTLTSNPEMSVEELAKDIARAVYNTGVSQGKIVHMAATDLSKLDALASKIGTFGQTLLTETGIYWYEVFEAWNNTHYTDYDDPTFVDLREYVINIQNEPNLGNIPAIASEAQALKDAINEAVIYTSTNAAGIPRGGLCIHFPWSQALFDSTNYVKTDFTATNWYKFLSVFIASISPGGDSTATVSGTVDWPGHSLSQYTYIFVDTLDQNNNVYTITWDYVNPSDGSYMVTVDLTEPLDVLFDAGDDVNNNGIYDSGEGWGFYDPDGDTSWTTADLITLSPGDNLSGINITLWTVAKQPPRVLKKLK